MSTVDTSTKPASRGSPQRVSGPCRSEESARSAHPNVGTVERTSHPPSRTSDDSQRGAAFALSCWVTAVLVAFVSAVASSLSSPPYRRTRRAALGLVALWCLLWARQIPQTFAVRVSIVSHAAAAAVPSAASTDECITPLLGSATTGRRPLLSAVPPAAVLSAPMGAGETVYAVCPMQNASLLAIATLTRIQLRTIIDPQLGQEAVIVGTVALCAEKGIAALPAALRYDFFAMDNGTCIFVREGFSPTSVSAPPLGSCAMPLYRTSFTFCGPFPAGTSEGGLTCGDECFLSAGGCCGYAGAAAGPSGGGDLSDGALIAIIVVAIVVGIALLAGIWALWVCIRQRRRRAAADGEEGRQRLHREGYCRGEAEATSMAEVILRPFTHPHRSAARRMAAMSAWERASNASNASSNALDESLVGIDLLEGLGGPRCPLCRGSVAGSAALATLPCGHQFHHACVRSALRRALLHYNPLRCPAHGCGAGLLGGSLAPPSIVSVGADEEQMVPVVVLANTASRADTRPLVRGRRSRQGSISDGGADGEGEEEEGKGSSDSDSSTDSLFGEVATGQRRRMSSSGLSMDGAAIGPPTAAPTSALRPTSAYRDVSKGRGKGGPAN